MSISILVLAQRSRLPATADWQRAIAGHGFAVNLDQTCELSTHEGFWPATYAGRPAGFEVSCDSSEQALRDYPGIAGDFDVAVTLVTHSSMDEGCSAWLSAASLAHLCSGVLIDESSGETVRSSEVLSWAREVEQEATR